MKMYLDSSRTIYVDASSYQMNNRCICSKTANEIQTIYVGMPPAIRTSLTFRCRFCQKTFYQCSC